MANEIKTEIALKEPISVIIETKEKEKKELYWNAQRLDLLKWFIGTLKFGIIT